MRWTLEVHFCRTICEGLADFPPLLSRRTTFHPGGNVEAVFWERFLCLCCINEAVTQHDAVTPKEVPAVMNDGGSDLHVMLAENETMTA